jgi:uncharacterized RDD family membrane protein YckC
LSPSAQNVGENLTYAGTEVVPAWKQELNERLAATRSRRLRIRGEQVALPGLEPVESKVESRASRLAAKVAQRYANAPSYSEVFAAKAQAQAQRVNEREAIHEVPQAPPPSWSGLLDNELISAAPQPASAVSLQYVEPALETSEQPEEEVLEPLAVSLVEVPRELVAARKLRPRLAEGPLQQDQPQLKIFELAPESISKAVAISEASVDWSPIRLDIDPAALPAGEKTSSSPAIPLKTAALEDRVMAAIFDFALVVAAFALFVLVFVACTAHPPTGKPALLSAVSVLVGFCLLYQYLFFKYAEGTPGMRYAKIALCTFEDENPTRKAMCRRVLFLLLSAAPLGLGFVWAWFDPDRLGWHDRMSRIYQRSYS